MGMALCLFVLWAFRAHGTTLYWMEANFGAPRLVMADGSGAIKSTLAIAAQSLPQALAINPATNAVFWTELAFLNAHVKFARADLGDSGTVVSLQSSARGIAVDSTNKKIYWTATNLTAGPGIFRGKTSTGLRRNRLNSSARRACIRRTGSPSTRKRRHSTGLISGRARLTALPPRPLLPGRQL